MKLYLIPKEGFKVLDPETYKALAAEGEFKEPTSYWHRRLRDGDVRTGEPPVAKPASSKTK